MTKTNNSERPLGDISRRTIVKGAAWSVPVIAAAAAAPLASASPCKPTTFPISNGTTTAPNPQQVVLTYAANGHSYTVTIDSTLGPNTVIAQTGGTPSQTAGFNLSTAGSGWNGGTTNLAANDMVFNNFAPAAGAGAIVLNQRTRASSEPDGSLVAAFDSQTLTFTFRRDGVVFDPQSLQVDVFDISSVWILRGDNSPAWRECYWDAVGFSAQPTSITSVSGAYGLGSGAGTVADPYRRANDSSPTVAGQTILDRFSFSSFASGSTMTYTSYQGSNASRQPKKGWHFISIAGITFTDTVC